MEDPHASLRTLRSVLHRDGVMHLMVYAKYGRTGVYMFPEYCRMLGVTPTADGLSELQQILSGCAAYRSSSNTRRSICFAARCTCIVS